MVWQALYRKWRSRDFDELVGQEHVTTTLRNAVRAGRVSHAYLFCGPRGTGKTSVARILAKAVNCLAPEGERPCNQCVICQSVNESRALDLIEIDAASNRGIDEIRDLREKVHYAPNEMRTKFYIIDEAHMLTNEAFNALLKTLEEPPAHVIFVLATTEPHKIPATVLSRCQRFDFRRIPLRQITGHLQTICQAEGFDVEPAALEFIGRAATGSLRDAISLLDQLAGQASEKVTLAEARRILGAAGSESVSQLVDCWLAGATADGLRLLARVNDEGADLRQFNRQVVEHLRGVLLLKAADGLSARDGAHGQADGSRAGGPEKGKDLVNVPADVRAVMQAQADRTDIPALARAIRLFNEADRDLRASARGEPLLPLELAFVEAVLPPAEAAPAAERLAPAEPTRKPAPAANQPAPSRSSRPAAPREPAKERPAAGASAVQPAEPHPAVSTGPVSTDPVQARWNSIVAAVRSKNKTIHALLIDGKLKSVDGDTVVVAFRSSFHRDRLDTPANRRVVEDVLSQELSGNYHVRFVLATEESSSPPKTDLDRVAEDPVVQAAVSMGGRIAEIKK